jgi:hypothetical protein
MNASLVIVTYNQFPHLQRCLDSILKYTSHPYELIIVNQNSTDGTKDYLDSFKNKHTKFVGLIHNSNNTGCSAGWNQGIKAATGDPVIVLNDDIVLSPNWMKNALEFKDKYPKDLFSIHVLDRPEVRNLVENDIEGWERHATSIMEREKDVIEEGFQGCGIGLSRDLLNAVGLFDEGYIKVSYEDVDFCHRVYLAGRKAQITHSSLMYHYGGVTQSYVASREGQGHLSHNRNYFEKKFNINLDGAMCNRSIMWKKDPSGQWQKVTCTRA